MAICDTSIVLFGSLSQFTYFTLANLVERKFRLLAVVLDAYSPAELQSAGKDDVIFRSTQHQIFELCNQQGLSIYFSEGDEDQLAQFLRDLPADLFLLSCYPRKLPRSIVQLARLRCINIHPSKLPAYKGANPIFWQLRFGETQTGVTLHEVSEHIDGGAILMFEALPYHVDMRLCEIESMLIEGAIAGLETLLNTAPANWVSYPQQAHQSTWHPQPCDDDCLIDRQMSSRVSYALARAYSGTNLPLRIVENSHIYNILDAVWPDDRDANSSCRPETGFIVADFSDGKVKFTVEQVNFSK